MTPTVLHCGEQAVTIQLSDEIDEAANRRVIALADSLEQAPISGVVECVPTYRSLLVRYDPARVRGAMLERDLLARYDALDEVQDGQGRLWRLPILYGGTIGQDFEELAREKGLSAEELIALHSGAEYRVYMIGFAPGFAYLGGLPKILHTPRLPRPRQNIPAGAIGIGGQQGNINSLAGPSGWRFLAWTPIRIFDPRRADPFLLHAGDRVRFFAVDRTEAESIDEASARGEAVVEPEDAA